MRHYRSLPAARGFSLPELLVAVTIGLLLLAGLSTMFVKNMRTQDEIEKASRQVENGRFAMDQVTVDLRNAGFYAEFDPTVLPAPPALPAPCALTLAGLNAGLVLPVQGADNSATALGCLSDVRAKTDVLVLRRTATCVTGAAGCDPASAGGAFFQASLCNNPSELDSPNPTDFYALGTDPATLLRHQRNCTQVAGTGTVANVRRYLVHIYYIANNNQPGDRIPTLKRAELGSDASGLAWNVVPLAEGIENLQLEYGLDLAPATSGDGVADQYTSDPSGYNGCAADNCAIANWRSVVAVKLHLLSRNTTPSKDYKDTKTYTLGDVAIPAAYDGYRRHVFQSLVSLPNPAGRRIP
jgi:type IV pilus assembly protein PilW